MILCQGFGPRNEMVGCSWLHVEACILELKLGWPVLLEGHGDAPPFPTKGQQSSYYDPIQGGDVLWTAWINGMDLVQMFSMPNLSRGWVNI